MVLGKKLAIFEIQPLEKGRKSPEMYVSSSMIVLIIL